MDIRQALSDDLVECEALPASVQSTHVWQLRLAYDPLSAQSGGELGGSLHRTRLPRPIQVVPATPEPLEMLWQRAADVMIAEDEQGIAGYIVLRVLEAAPTVMIERLVVAPHIRRSGIGGLLIRAAAQWGSAYQLESLVAHCPARNDPAANFYMRWGLRFAGYSEAFYPRAEVALFWQRPL
jgi:GNAT superfamily N-acetyltransferase